MLPKLYKEYDYMAEGNGFGILTHAESVKIEENRNGVYTLNMSYFLDGKLADELIVGRLIKSIDHNKVHQLFRIVKVGKNTNGDLINVEAEHISYDLLRYPIKSRITLNTANITNQFKPEHVDFIGVCGDLKKFPPFIIKYDDSLGHTTINQFINVTNNLKSSLYGAENSLLSHKNGEFYFDSNGLKITLYQNRSDDFGKVLTYGKEILDADVERSIASTYTHIYPYAIIENENKDKEYVTLPEKILACENASSFEFENIKAVDLSEKAKTVDSLRVQAKSYMSANGFGLPNINLKLTLKDFKRCINFFGNELDVDLCEIITISIHRLGIKVKAKIEKIEYNPLTEEIEAIEIGKPKIGLSDVIKSNDSDKMMVNFNNSINSIDESVSGKLQKYIRGKDGKRYELVVTDDGNGKPNFELKEVKD